jgi:anaerobic selenocysteine-containing dehydrogenase
LLDRTICATAGKAGYAATIGASIGTDLEQFEKCQADPDLGLEPGRLEPAPLEPRAEAKRRGARLVAIDPYRSQTAEKCHEHLALMPGTDAALALGIMHVLIAEDLIDRDYIDRYTGIRCAGRARARLPAVARRVAHWIAEAQIIALGSRLRHHRARRDPSELRHAKACRRRHGDPHGCAACLRWIGVAPRRGRRASIVQRHVSDQHGGARASRAELE